ncbi:kinase [Vibrio sp. 10N.286.49.B3]|uniref:YcjF family protein n=1 Tax=Vibrio sp. 10N.286.49.B3 TaxID=1880855 RepID=UPI000C843C60|nr:GTPase [Vibrio sp. 10N.286.49.B3]PMH44617.1 kinase [Vibrio sp. 10N.286.49.B3]
MFDKIKKALNPSKNPDLLQACDYQCQHLPTLWLLGKTGAGKSSLIQSITGLSSVEVGNGFAPCTMTAQAYDFPQEKPVMRFLDTRGLGEAEYDPSDDLDAINPSSHGLVVVMKADDPEQSSLLAALKRIKKQKIIRQLLLVHSGVQLVDESERARLIAFNHSQVAGIWGKDFATVTVDFHADKYSDDHSSHLIDSLIKLLPIIEMMVIDKTHSSIEESNFNQVEKEILWYAGSAGVSDLVPAVGLVTVPTLQAKMLHSLANQYGVEWNKRILGELVATLGSSFAMQYSIKLGARQLVKFIPVYGQTVGSVTAAAMSFGTTYGLGRAACFYFYHKSKGEPVSQQKMQTLYKNALRKGKAVSGYDED